MSDFKLTKDLAISITESLPVGVLLADDDGKIVYTNPKADDVFGYDKEELTGHFVEELIPKKHRHSHSLLRKSYIENPNSTNIAMSGGRVLTGLKKIW